MGIMHSVGTRVTVMDNPALLSGTVVGYGFDHVTGNVPRNVYLVELDQGDYILNESAFIRIIVVCPDNLSASELDDGPYKASPGGY